MCQKCPTPPPTTTTPTLRFSYSCGAYEFIMTDACAPVEADRWWSSQEVWNYMSTRQSPHAVYGKTDGICTCRTFVAPPEQQWWFLEIETWTIVYSSVLIILISTLCTFSLLCSRFRGKSEHFSFLRCWDALRGYTLISQAVAWMTPDGSQIQPTECVLVFCFVSFLVCNAQPPPPQLCTFQSDDMPGDSILSTGTILGYKLLLKVKKNTLQVSSGNNWNIPSKYTATK